MNLDQRIARHDGLGRKGARLAIAAGRVSVAGLPVRNPGVEVDRFSAVALDGVLLPDVEVARHVMLHKPAGILSATSDPAWVTPPFWKQICAHTPIASMSFRRAASSYEPGAISSYVR